MFYKTTKIDWKENSDTCVTTVRKFQLYTYE